MFVELDMSIRGIAHKLTEDGILPPAKSRGVKVKGTTWQPSTVFDLLTDEANIGILQICKSTTVMKPDGNKTRKRSDKMKSIPGGIPAIISIDMYERTQIRLKSNKACKSHEHDNLEDFLLKGHIFCKTCNYRMVGRNQRRKEFVYPYYRCVKYRNKYNACPDLPALRTDNVNKLVWEDCCRVFERLDLIRNTIEQNIEHSLQNILEDTKGSQLIIELEEEIAYAKQERDKHKEGSYYYKLISQDISAKEEQLQRYKEEYAKSRDIVRLSGVYQKSIMSFFDFLGTMKGRYHEASFKEKRNAIEVLGVKVYISPDTQEAPSYAPIETDREWMILPEAAKLTGINLGTLTHHVRKGNIKSERREVPTMVLHKDEVAKFLMLRGRDIDLDQYEEEWFTLHRLAVLKIGSWHTFRRYLELGKIKADTKGVIHTCIHRDEMDR